MNVYVTALTKKPPYSLSTGIVINVRSRLVLAGIEQRTAYTAAIPLLHQQDAPLAGRQIVGIPEMIGLAACQPRRNNLTMGFLPYLAGALWVRSAAGSLVHSPTRTAVRLLP